MGSEYGRAPPRRAGTAAGISKIAPGGDLVFSACARFAYSEKSELTDLGRGVD
jgi:hypothetical protein